MSQPLVSVIIPTHNRAKYLSLAIESILNQIFDSYEIIVIDDGSTDNTKEVVQKYGQRVRYLYQENSGVSTARNKGIESARGEWVAFLDDDDEWLPDYLSFQVARALQNPEACMHMTNSEEVFQEGGKTDTFQIKKIGEEIESGSCYILERPLQFVIEKHITALQSTMIRRQSLLKAGLFDPLLSIAEDLDVIARVALEGPLGICNKTSVKIIHRRYQDTTHSLSSQMYLKGIRTRKSFETVYRKLLPISALTREEKLAVKIKLGRNQRALGNMLLRDDQLSEARECYRDALQINPSIASLVRYALAFLPKKIASSLIFKGRHVTP